MATKQETRDKARAKRLMDNYKLTVEQYDAILKEQNGVCYMCGCAEPVKGRRLSVDHDHDTGQIRGLLCSRCNPILGKLERAYKRYGLHKEPKLTFERFVFYLHSYVQNPGWIVERAVGHRIFGYKGHVGTKAHRKRIQQDRKKGT